MGDRVRGMGEAAKQAEEGMKLFKKEDELEFDAQAAQAFKDQADADIKKLEEEAAALTGKDNKKARTEKSKQASSMKTSKEYIDALKVLKGLPPPNGNFVKKVAAKEEPKEAPKEETKEAPKEDEKKKKEKEDKKEKKKESAGISRAEKDELEKLKNQIIEKKKTLKEQGMSGGQMNKDEEIVAWVTRMNELKEKEDPGSVAAGKDDKKPKKKKLDSETTKLIEEKQKALDEYAEKLRTEYKYSKKEINADPDYADMKAEIDKMSK